MEVKTRNAKHLPVVAEQNTKKQLISHVLPLFRLEIVVNNFASIVYKYERAFGGNASAPLNNRKTRKRICDMK